MFTVSTTAEIDRPLRVRRHAASQTLLALRHRGSRASVRLNCLRKRVMFNRISGDAAKHAARITEAKVHDRVEAERPRSRDTS